MQMRNTTEAQEEEEDKRVKVIHDYNINY